MIVFHRVGRLLPFIILPSIMVLVNMCVVESKAAAYFGPVPKPGSGQPHGRYYWVKSAMEKLRSGCRLEVCSNETEQRLGMANGDIPDDSITASSYASHLITKESYAPKRARLDIQGEPPGWCAKFASPNPWIQVDLKDKMYITGLITQGYDDTYYVKTYQVSYSDDGKEWVYVRNPDGSQTKFSGNYDGESHVTNRFMDGFKARLVRISPLLWNYTSRTDGCCMRFEVLGCKK